MIYLVPISVLAFCIVGYDSFDMTKLPGIGARYLFRLRYWFVVAIRLLWEVGLVAGPFTAGNRYLSGNLDITVPNVVSTVALTAAVAVGSLWREEAASKSPHPLDPYTFFQTLKSYVTAAILQGKEESVQQRALKDKVWLLKFDMKELRDIYKRLYLRQHGQHSGPAVTAFLNSLGKDHPQTMSRKERLAEEIGKMAKVSWLQKFLRATGRGQYSHSPKRRKKKKKGRRNK